MGEKRALEALEKREKTGDGRGWFGRSIRSTARKRAAMRFNKLGSSDMEVSNVCLGTMTFGQQNTEKEAHEQLDYAIKERGVNFLDTAELYPVPTKRETQGLTEKYIGTWLAKNADLREKVYV